MSKHLHFGRVYPRGVIPEVLGFVEIQFCNPKLCCHVLFTGKRLSPGKHFKQALLVQFFLISMSPLKPLFFTRLDRNFAYPLSGPYYLFGRKNLLYSLASLARCVAWLLVEFALLVMKKSITYYY